MFHKIPKHPNYAIKWLFLKKFYYFVKFPEVFQSTYKSSERRRALAPPIISPHMPSEAIWLLNGPIKIPAFESHLTQPIIFDSL